MKQGGIAVYDEQGEIRNITAGEYLGEDALLGDGHHAFNARAEESSVLVSLPSRAFHQIIQGGTSLSRLFKKSASKYESRELIKKLAAKLSRRVEQKSARELMTPNPKALHGDMTVDEALTIARDHPHSYYPLTDAKGRIQGAVHRSDLYEFLKRLDFTPDTKLGNGCAVQLPIVAPECTVDQVVERFIRTGSNKLLVADDSDGPLLGIITLMDLVLLAESTEKRGSL